MWNSIAKTAIKVTKTYLVWKAAYIVVDGSYALVSKLRKDGARKSLSDGVATVVKNAHIYGIK